MEETDTQRPERVVRFSKRALSDLREIGIYTELRWGLAQSEHYLELLRQQFLSLAAKPCVGEKVFGFSRTYSFVFKSTTDRSSHGYRIFYQFDELEIMVTHLIHTARDWQSLISDQD